MSDLIIRCEIDDCGQHVWTSARELRVTRKGNFEIKIISDPSSLFDLDDINSEDFIGLSKAEVIQKFKNSCVEVYTCGGIFSIDQLKRKGNDIRFY